MQGDRHPLQRFSDRVGDYVRFRPSYPAALLDCLEATAGLAPGARVADVGAGTGLFTRLLLDRGAEVFAVEPNAAMRAAAERDLAGRQGFHSVRGMAEATALPAGSVALVTCAQAFHWFDTARARDEFRRILAAGGRCALIWNLPPASGTPFGLGYERIKEDFKTDFHEVRRATEKGSEHMDLLYGKGRWERRTFGNHQDLDLESLIGRMRSSSYAPKEGQPGYDGMVEALTRLFGQFQVNGLVRLHYETEFFLGTP